MATSTTTTANPITTWQIDPVHSEVGFSVRHLMISTVKGRFTDVQGTLQYDETDPTRSNIEVRIAIASVDTRADQRDAHLRSADFFDAEHYPFMTFKSTRVERTGEGRGKVTGDLTIRGVTQSVTLDAKREGRGKDPWGGERLGFSATTVLNREAFGLTWNQALETGGVVVGDEVKVSIEVEWVKQ
jgi:polyisoprenoid-binding protein YceI